MLILGPQIALESKRRGRSGQRSLNRSIPRPLNSVKEQLQTPLILSSSSSSYNRLSSAGTSSGEAAMGNCAAKPLALDDAPLPLEKLPSMNGSSVDGDAFKEEEEAAATAKSTSPEHEPLLKSKEVDESNKNDASEAQEENAENIVSETHTLASEPAEEKKGVMDHEITDETTPANPQGTVVVTPQDLTIDEDKDAAFAKPEDPEAIIIEDAALSEANVEPEDSKAKVQVEAQDIDAIVKEPKDEEATTIIATPQENPAPLEAQENDATKASKEKKKGDVFHTLFSMYNDLVKKP